MIRKYILFLCPVAALLGLFSSLLIAYYLYDQRQDGYSSAVYAVLAVVATAEAVASAVFAVRRSVRSGVLFVVCAAPLAIYEFATTVGGVGITHFASAAALAVGMLALFGCVLEERAGRSV